MSVLARRPSDVHLKRLSRRWYAYQFADDFVLLYPVYALLFADSGMSVAQISSLFVIWSAAGIVLEVPSGALADATSRRRLMVIAPLLSSAGFALWVLMPSYPVFAVGFLLWGAKGALQSGAAEALLYEELDRLGATDRYAAILGRSQALTAAAVLSATALAAPVFAIGGYGALGAVSVAAGPLAAVIAAGLPEHRDGTGEPRAEGLRKHLAMLRAGLRELRGNPTARRAVLLIPVIAAIWGMLEEYVPLLAADVAPTGAVPLLVLLVAVGTVVGALLAGRAARMSQRRMAGLLAVGTAVMAAGSISGSAAGFVLVAGSFALFQLVDIVANVRLQEAIEGSARATVTSVAGLGTDLIGIAIVAGYGLGAVALDHGALFGLFALGYLLPAAALARGPWKSG